MHNNNKNYSLHVMEDGEGNFFHCVFEEQTQQVIDFYYFLDDAVETAKFMESGGAFAGFTPAFMLREVNVGHTTEDLNSKFTEFFDG